MKKLWGKSDRQWAVKVSFFLLEWPQSIREQWSTSHSYSGDWWETVIVNWLSVELLRHGWVWFSPGKEKLFSSSAWWRLFVWVESLFCPPRPGTLQQNSFTSILIRHWRKFGSGPLRLHTVSAKDVLNAGSSVGDTQYTVYKCQFPGIAGIHCFLASSRLFVNMIILQHPIKFWGRLLLDCRYHTYFCV